MDRERVVQIERAAKAGLDRWQARLLGNAPGPLPRFDANLDVIRDMPRRKPVHGMETANVVLPMAQRTEFTPGLTRTIARLLLWAWMCIRLLAGNTADTFMGRSTVERRASRLRRVFEDAGASFAKVAQQLALRADLLPYAYCAELGKLLDRAKPFPTDQAIQIIERSLGQPISAVFAVFDPVPIGSASLACVYQAVLRSGERVAVKVRRPDVGMMLAADLRALDWILIIGEVLTIVRPGSTRRLRSDLEKILMMELNFRNEARFTDIFRRRSEAAGSNITSPRIYFSFCSDEVMVSEFVSGVWMWEIMSAVDSNDVAFLARLRAQGIEPKSLARKLIRSAHHELLESLFFHADPHPANIVVQPGNRLCFVDFGAIGRLSPRMRSAWRELHYHMSNGDIERMVRCTLNFSGSLPPVDVDRIIDSLETIYADWIYAMNSDDAEWWERSTAQTMLRFFSVAREHGLPANLETIQFLRATLLYDTIVARLDSNINFADEWSAYAKRAGKAARARMQKSVRKRLGGLANSDYLKLEQLGDTVTQFLFNWQRKVEEPIVHYKSIVGKIAYTVALLLRVAGVLLVLVGVGAAVHAVANSVFGYSIPWTRMVETVAAIGWLQAGALVAGLLVMRRLFIRLNQPDTKPDIEK